MKFVYPEIDYVFDFEHVKVYSVIIENQKLLYDLLTDIRNQLRGLDGRTVLSYQNKMLAFDKSADLLDQLIGFSLNQRALITRATAELARRAVNEDHYVETMELVSELEKYLYQLSLEIDGDLTFERISPESILKVAGIGFREEYDSLAEKILDYFELVTEYDRKKLFILYNLRSLLDDQETEQFLAIATAHDYNVLMIESSCRPLVEGEKRVIIDDTLCVIQ